MSREFYYFFMSFETSLDFLYSLPDTDKLPMYSERSFPQCFFHFRCYGYECFFRKVRKVYEIITTVQVAVLPFKPEPRYRADKKEWLCYSGVDFDKALDCFTRCVKYLTNAYLPDIVKTW